MKFVYGVLLVASVLVTTGCEAVGGGVLDAAAADGAAVGFAAEEAAVGGAEFAEGAVIRGARGGALAEAAEGAELRSGWSRFGEEPTPARNAPRVVETSGWRRFGESEGRASEGGARAVERSAPRAQLNSYTVRVRGAQPFEGITRHFDRQGSYRGYSVHAREVSYHYDEGGRLTGRTAHRADGSIAWDAQGKYKGYSIDTPDGTSVFDAEGGKKGYNTRLGERIYYYDEHGNYTGYSVIEPPSSVSAGRLVIVPAGSDCTNKPSTGLCAPVRR